MGTVRIHNSVAANITATLSNPAGQHTSGKAHQGHDITLDLSKMVGWKIGDVISISVHADAGVTRHNNSGEYDPTKDYRYRVSGTLDAFSVQGPE